VLIISKKSNMLVNWRLKGRFLPKTAFQSLNAGSSIIRGPALFFTFIFVVDLDFFLI
jgi:hypothetical protein